MEDKFSRYRESRSSGRGTDYEYNISENLVEIMLSRKQDIYNNSDTFNIWEGLIHNLEDLLSPYYDERYRIDYDSLIEIYQDNNPKTQSEKIELVSERYRKILQLAKRGGFLPADDVEGDSNIIINDLYKRIKDNYDAMVLVTGQRGIGKSTAVIGLQQDLATKFGYDWSLETNVFNNSDLLREWILNNKPPRGWSFLYDEAGADKGLSRRRTQTLESIEFNEVLQTCRELGLIVFYTAPSDLFITGTAESIFTNKIEGSYRHPRTNYKIVRYKYGEAGSDKMYWKFHKTPTGERITSILIPPLNEKLYKKYTEFKKNLVYEKMKTKRMKKATEKEDKKFNPIKYAKKLLKSDVKELRNRNGNFDLEKIVYFFRKKKEVIGRGRANQIRLAMEEMLNEQKD